MNDKELKKDFDSIFEGCEILDCPNCNNTGYYSSIHINKKTQEPEEVPVQCNFVVANNIADSIIIVYMNCLSKN